MVTLFFVECWMCKDVGRDVDNKLMHKGAPGRFFDGHIFDGHIIDGHFFDGTYFRQDIFLTKHIFERTNNFKLLNK